MSETVDNTTKVTVILYCFCLLHDVERDLLALAKFFSEDGVESVDNVCRMTRAAQHACDMDARNKQHGQTIDERMHQLHNDSPGLGHYPGIETYDNTLVCLNDRPNMKTVQFSPYSVQS